MTGSKKYNIIYADPPWRYEQRTVQGGAEQHYPTMMLDDICALPVAELADKDCALFLWTTFPKLKEAFWTRSNAEVCLLALKGHPKRQCAGIHQFVIAHLEQHSKKPDEVRDKIIKLMGDVPRVELFARQKTPGWDVWGNEVESDIILPERSA